MTVFLIVVAVLAVIIIAVLSLSATVTLVYDKGWHTTVQVLFIEKDIVLSEILSFILFPERKADEVSEKKKNKQKKQTETPPAPQTDTTANKADENKAEEKSKENTPNNPQKSNPIKKIWDDDGVVGILTFASNLVETANSAILTLFRGLHIYSFYVMIIVGGGDADLIGRAYGTLCSVYYPIKGIILNGMKVDNYDDYIKADFIADRTEFEFQLIASINVGLILKVGIKAGFIFVKNLISNKKSMSKLEKGDKQL